MSRPRLTPEGNTYLAARDLAMTMYRARTGRSEAWLAGFVDGLRAAEAQERAERATADSLDDLARNERCMSHNRSQVEASIARTAAEEIGEK